MLIMSKKIVYKESLKRAIRNHEKRPSEDGVKKLQEGITEITDQIIEDAAELTEHADRKTIQEEDVKAALRNYSN